MGGFAGSERCLLAVSTYSLNSRMTHSQNAASALSSYVPFINILAAMRSQPPIFTAVSPFSVLRAISEGSKPSKVNSNRNEHALIENRCQ